MKLKYKPEELFSESEGVKKEILDSVPEGNMRMGMNMAWRGKEKTSTIFRDMIDVCEREKEKR